jgi:hypothetical protein
VQPGQEGVRDIEVTAGGLVTVTMQGLREDGKRMRLVIPPGEWTLAADWVEDPEARAKAPKTEPIPDAAFTPGPAVEVPLHDQGPADSATVEGITRQGHPLAPKRGGTRFKKGKG